MSDFSDAVMAAADETSRLRRERDRWKARAEAAEREAERSEKYAEDRDLVAQQLEAERDRLREALRFYADPVTYEERGVQVREGVYEPEVPIWDDQGETARAALADQEGEK